MKANLKGLSGPAIKGWFLTHGEKLALGAAALVFVMLVYKAIGRESLPPDKEPLKLAEKATQANQHVQNSKWDGSGLQPPVYVERAKRENIAAANYKLRSFNRPIYEIKGKRGDPTILAAEGMRVSAGHGILALLPAQADPNAPPPQVQNLNAQEEVAPGQGRLPGVRAPAGSMPEGKYWAAITGLIPIKKQLGEYQKEFERAKAGDRAADVVNYLGYMIERAEINPSAPDQLNWQSLDKNKPFRDRWAVTAREIVDSRFVDVNFTMPLPPLLGEDWGASVAHPAEVPLLGAATPPPAPDENKPPVNDAPKPGQEFGGFGEQVAKPAPPPEALTAAPAANKPADYKLFRFFDFTVEPGKQYRYRIVLGLKNPNHLVPVQYLKNAESTNNPVLRSPLSEPTPVVFIPKAEQILAGPRPSDRRIVGEPETNVMLTKFDREKGTFAAKDIRVMRGNLTFYEGNVIVRDPIKNALKEDKIRFDHNALVLDIRGGQDLAGRVKTSTPMEVLLLDADGNIVTGGNELLARTELADAEEYKKQQDAIATPLPTKTGPTGIIDPNASGTDSGPSIIGTPRPARRVGTGR